MIYSGEPDFKLPGTVLVFLLQANTDKKAIETMIHFFIFPSFL